MPTENIKTSDQAERALEKFKQKMDEIEVQRDFFIEYLPLTGDFDIEIKLSSAKTADILRLYTELKMYYVANCIEATFSNEYLELVDSSEDQFLQVIQELYTIDNPTIKLHRENNKK